jgi:hypothetical protein
MGLSRIAYGRSRKLSLIYTFDLDLDAGIDNPISEITV